MLSDSVFNDVVGAPLLALSVALLWAVLLRGRRWAALALPLGALAGFAWVMGGFSASPRQWPERFPLLAAGALLLALPLAAWPRAWLGAGLALLAGLGTGWWMAGAPMVEADLRRALPLLVTLAVLVPLLHREAEGPWRPVMAALALLAGLWAAAPPGPWCILSLVLLGALLPLCFSAAGLGEAARLPFAMLLVALLAAPVVTRGAAQDWLGALAPLSVLLLAPRLAARGKGWQAPLVLLAAACLPVALAWWLRG